MKAKLQEKEAVHILFFIEIERLYSINEKYEREVVLLRQKDDEHVSKYNDIINKLNVLSLYWNKITDYGALILNLGIG